jgi:signal transduction histidine kinase
MGSSIVAWYRDWEQEMLDVLQDPDRIHRIVPGYRRRIAAKLVALSPIERRQLHAFSTTYRGWRFYAAVGKLLMLFSLCGTFLHLALPAKFGWTESILLANLLGLSMALAMVSVWFNYRKLTQQVNRKIGIVLVLSTTGAVVGASVAALVDGRSPLELLARLAPTVVTAGIVAGLVYAIIFGVIAAWRNKEYEALTANLQLEAERERLTLQLSESQLRLMRAQIEPHFLFNTLGAVQQLCEGAAPKAGELTANLIAFLRASLTEMRADSTCLDAEFKTIEAYCKVMKFRLGERLRYELELPAHLAAVALPSMVLLTLVENAIKHGIEPSLEGGEVRVAARAEGGLAVVSVINTGVELPAVPGAGFGLGHVRERLHLTYGDRASFSIDNRDSVGVVAELRVPMPGAGERTAARAAAMLDVPAGSAA